MKSLLRLVQGEERDTNGWGAWDWELVASTEWRTQNFWARNDSFFIMQCQRAVIPRYVQGHLSVPWQRLKCAAATALPTTAELKNWAEAKALRCWRAQCPPWEHMGLLLAHGGWDHLEGLLCTTAFYPEKVCSRYEKPGSAVRERSHLALEPGQLCLG